MLLVAIDSTGLVFDTARMISLVVHAIVGLSVVAWIVTSNRKVFSRPPGGPPVTALESVYYLVGVASAVLGWYFNVRFVRDYATGNVNPFWGPGNSGRLSEPGLHDRQCDSAARVYDRRRLPARVAPAVAVRCLQPVHQL